METKKTKHESSTEFSSWLRNQPELCSANGTIISDLDYVVKNYNTDEWMIIEEKRLFGCKKKNDITNSQRSIFQTIHNACSNDPNYNGFHLLTFENTNPDDSETIWLNNNVITKKQLIRFLNFKKI